MRCFGARRATDSSEGLQAAAAGYAAHLRHSAIPQCQLISKKTIPKIDGRKKPGSCCPIRGNVGEPLEQDRGKPKPLQEPPRSMRQSTPETPRRRSGTASASKMPGYSLLRMEIGKTGMFLSANIKIRFTIMFTTGIENEGLHKNTV